jgi:hypothetical protein
MLEGLTIVPGDDSLIADHTIDSTSIRSAIAIKQWKIAANVSGCQRLSYLSIVGFALPFQNFQGFGGKFEFDGHVRIGDLESVRRVDFFVELEQSFNSGPFGDRAPLEVFNVQGRSSHDLAILLAFELGIDLLQVLLGRSLNI